VVNGDEAHGMSSQVPVREILRVAEHGESWGVPADWA
jgi:hypothetical protein